MFARKKGAELVRIGVEGSMELSGDAEIERFRVSGLGFMGSGV